MPIRPRRLVRPLIAVPAAPGASAVPAFDWRAQRRRLLGLAPLALWLPPRLALAALARGDDAPAPALALNDLDGRRHALADFRGHVLIVNFWATWCAPCVQEMPGLAQLRERTATAGAEVLGVNHRENAARIRPFVERIGIGFPVLRDHDGSAASAWGVRVFPTTFVLDATHRVAYVAVGELDWSSADVESRIRALAAAAPATVRATGPRPNLPG